VVIFSILFIDVFDKRGHADRGHAIAPG